MDNVKFEFVKGVHKFSDDNDLNYILENAYKVYQGYQKFEKVQEEEK